MSIQSVLFVLVIFCIINDALSKPFGYEETDIVLPKFYNITITAREYDYDGQVEILTTFSNVTKTIKLNVYNTVTIETTKILHKYKGLWVRFPYQKHWTDPSEELYIIEFEYELMKNKEYKIIIDFSGIYSKYGFSMAVKRYKFTKFNYSFKYWLTFICIILSIHKYKHFKAIHICDSVAQ